MASGLLFGADVPPGFSYVPAFISPDEEQTLVAHLEHVTFSDFEMRGVVARRRVAFFGGSYEAARTTAPQIPAFLFWLRSRLAGWAAIDPEAFRMALINEYAPGAPIGWHRDAPQYDVVAGISLVSACRMRFRPYEAPRTRTSGVAHRRGATHEIGLEPRSAYLMTGESRSRYEHHIPPVNALRYSLTFRTLRSTGETTRARRA